MPLSKSTTDQIRKDGEDYSKTFIEKYRGAVFMGYEQGATVWAEKAEGLVKALEKIKLGYFGAQSIATEALEQYK